MLATVEGAGIVKERTLIDPSYRMIGRTTWISAMIGCTLDGARRLGRGR